MSHPIHQFLTAWDQGHVSFVRGQTMFIRNIKCPNRRRRCSSRAPTVTDL
jgi:hypothetical protein